MEWFHYSVIYIMSHKIAQISIILIRISLIFQTSIYFMMMKMISTYPFWYIQVSKLPWGHNLFSIPYYPWEDFLMSTNFVK